MATPSAKSMITLDVILPTYNRAGLLIKTLESLAAATLPEGLSISVLLVDNNSTDETRVVVNEFTGRDLPFPVTYLFEPTQGKCHALNLALRASTGDLIGMIDDDEEIDPTWFEVIQDTFRRTQADFIGGPYHPKWAAPRPDWVTLDIGGVVGWAEWCTEERPFEKEGLGILLGGNAVVKRSVFEVVGPYDTSLGRTSHGLLSCEDSDMFHRILDAGFQGLYVPSLIIHHLVLPERLTKAYHRSWHYGNGISSGVYSRRETLQAPGLFGIPRWRFRRCAEALLDFVISRVGLADKIKSFHGELQLWHLAGFLYGRYLRQVGAARAASIPSYRTLNIRTLGMASDQKTINIPEAMQW
jgi:glycosyltransferase involved in cell wall biosynthesis